MRKVLITALLLATLALPAFARASRDSGSQPADRAIVTRVIRFIRSVIGIQTNDEGEIVVPKPKP